MCEQMAVLKKIRDKGEINGHGVELAEATAKDYMLMNRKVARIEKDVSSIKKEQKKQGEMLAELKGEVGVIVKYISSPAEEERKNGIVWSEIKRFAKTPLGKTIILLFFFCLGLSGQRIMELTGIVS